VDARKFRFDVEVTEGDRTIGVGTHERRLIDVGTVGRVSADDGQSESEG
jgi:predicted thioesterase